MQQRLGYGDYNDGHVDDYHGYADYHDDSCADYDDGSANDYHVAAGGEFRRPWLGG